MRSGEPVCAEGHPNNEWSSPQLKFPEVMSFNFKRPTETVAIVDVGDAIDVRNAEAIGSRCGTAVRAGVQRVIFDLRTTTLVDSEGIAMLISLRRRVSRATGGNGEVILSGVRAEARSTFELTRTERLFTFVDDFTEAVNGLREQEN